MKAVILHDHVPDGANPDALDTLRQVQAVGQALKKLGHTVEVMEFSLNLEAARERLRAAAPDFVFNLVECVEGHGRLIHLAPTLLEIMGLPYTGAGEEAMSVTSNKTLAKRIMKLHGIPTPGWITPQALEHGACPGAEAATLACPSFDPARPWIVKSRWEHASIGLDEDILRISDGGSAEELRAAFARFQAATRGECFAAQYIDGREFNIALLDSPGGPEVLAPSEIQFVDFPADKPKVVGYKAKWIQDSFEYKHTPRRYKFPAADKPLLDELGRISKECWRVFGMRGYARVDFRVDAKGQPWVLEVNANPCLSLDAGYAATLKASGVPYADAIARIVAAARPVGLAARQPVSGLGGTGAAQNPIEASQEAN